MAKVLPLPDGSTVAIREGETPEQTWDRAQRMYPEAFGGAKEEEKAKKRPGFFGSVGQGGEQLFSSQRTGIASLFDKDKAAEAGIERQKDIQQRYGEQPGWTEVTKAYEEKGLPSAIGEYLRQIPNAMAQQAPQIAESAAAARTAALVTKNPYGALAGAFGPSFAQQYGGFIEAQAQEQKEKGEPVDVNRFKAAAFAAPAAAIDVATMLIPMGRSIAKAIFGPGIEKLLTRGATAEAEKIAAAKLADEGFLKTLGKGTAKGVAFEIPGEVTQQFLQRAQSGQSLFDEEALADYGQTAFEVSKLGLIGGAGRYMDRSGARQTIQAEQEATDRKQAAEAAKEAAAKAQADAQAEVERKQSPDYAKSVVTQYDDLQKQKQELIAQKRKIVDASPTADADRAFNAEITQKLKAIGAEIKPLAGEYNRVLPIVQQEAEKARIAGLTPEEYALEQAQTVPATKTKTKAVEPDLGGYYEQQIATPPLKASPVEQANKYIQERMALAREQLYTPDVDGYFDYLMQDPTMARTVVNNRLELPGLKKREQNALIDSMTMHLDEMDASRDKAKAAARLSAQERLGTVETEEQKGLDAQRAEEERIRVEAERRRKLAPEELGLQRLGKTPEGSLAGAFNEKRRQEQQRNVSEEVLVDTLMSTVPTEGRRVAPSQIVTGIGGTARTLSDLKAQRDLAQITGNSQLVKKLTKDIKEIEADAADRANAPQVAVGEKRTPEMGEGVLPEGRAKEVEADKHIDAQNATLQSMVRMLEDLRRGRIMLPGTAKTRTDGFKQQYLQQHLDEIAARREAFGLPPMADWEVGEARARVMEALNELESRWGQAVPRNAPKGQRTFGAPMEAVQALQEQVRQNIYDNLTNAAIRFKDQTAADLAEKTGPTGTQYYTEDAQGNKKPIKIEQPAVGKRIAAPAELTLRGEARSEPSTEDMIEALLSQKETRERAVPTTTVKPPKKVTSLADISTMLDKERSDGKLEPMSEGSIELLEKLQDLLPQTTDADFKELARKIVRQIYTGNEPNLFDVRDLSEMSKGMEAAGQSATRPGATPEELQRTSAQPQRELFPEASVQTARETPRNFQNLLDSKNVQGLRQAINDQKEANIEALKSVQTALPAAQQALNAAVAKSKKAAEKAAGLGKSLTEATKEQEWWADAVRAVTAAESAIDGLPIRINQLKEIRKGVAGLTKQGKADLGLMIDTALNQAANPATPAAQKDALEVGELRELKKFLDTETLDAELKRLENLLRAAKKAVVPARERLTSLLKEYGQESVVRESLAKEHQKALSAAKKAEEEANAATRAAAEAAKAEEAKTAVEEGTAMAQPTYTDTEYQAALQRAREGLNLPGRRNLVDTVAMKETIFNLRRAMGSFDALIAKTKDETKKAEFQAKRDNAAEKLASVYENAPRITSDIKESGQIQLERAFDDAQAAAFDQQTAKRRARKGELTPVLPSSKAGPLVKETRGARISQTGEKKSTPASESAGTALEKLAEERAKLADLQRREQFMRDNNKAKEKGRYTDTFKTLLADIEAQKQVVSQVAQEQGKVVAEVRATAQALGNKPVQNVASETTVGLKGEEATIPKAPKALFRTVTRGPTSLQTQQVENLVKRITAGWVNAPEIVVVKSEEDLPVRIRGQIVREDREAGTTPGVFDAQTKKVYLVADNLSNANDVILTVAHEVAGHYGLREMLGGTYNATMDRLYSGNPEVRKQADAKLKTDKNLTKQMAVEEALAEMAEKDKPTPVEKSALRQLYERLRVWLRSKLGLTNVSDDEVQQIVANARRYVIEGGVAAEGQAPAGEALYRTKKADYGTEDALSSLAKKVIAQPKTFKERVGNFYALEKEMEYVDMRAGLREALKAGAKELGDTKGFEQAMYNVTKADQKMSLVNASLENGPMELYTDEKGFRGIRSTNKNSAAAVFKAISDIPGGNEQAKVNKATTYMIAQRAENKGLAKLDLGALGVTEAELKAAMAAANADPAMKAALENVRRTYNAYNKGQVEFLASTGAIPKSVAEKLLADEDYVPYYRVDENGLADLVFGDEVTINIGDIRHQPYLNELKGGETRILPLTESLTRNTMLLMDKAVTNLAAKNVSYAMQSFGEGRGPDGKNLMPIHKGSAPAGSNIVKFNQEPDPKDPKDDGQRWLRVATDGTVMGGIPPELIVKSLEGAHLTLPTFLKIGGIAGDILRAGVTRTPIYIGRQLVRDPMAASFTGGLNYGPLRAVVKAGKEFIASSRGQSTLQKTLIEKGLIQSGIFTGDPDDISKIALQLASGKNQGAIDSFFAMMDRAAMRADSATRALVYENAIKNGLSEVQADMMTMESMNFYKRGLSPTVQYASRLIPFFNAQIQGLNVLYKAATGKMPYEEQQKIKQKFFNNALMLVATGMVYAMAMDDDETFRNAKPKDKYSNFFIPLPGVDEPFKLPIPYEAGWFFSLAVAAVDAMKEETDGKQQFQALRDMFLQSIPGYSSRGMPQIAKPVFEVWTNKNFYSGNAIESARMEKLTPQQRFNETTTEAAKGLSKLLPFLSPIQIEHLSNGYFGQIPLIVMSAADGLFRKETRGEPIERRVSELPLIGSSFQRKYGGADSDVMFRLAEESMQAKATYDDMRRKGQVQDAKDFLEENRGQIATAGMARNYRNMMGKLRTDQEHITNMEKLTAAEKRARIDKLDAVRQELADKYEKAIKKAEAGGRT
jgi:hypothetical protein